MAGDGLFFVRRDNVGYDSDAEESCAPSKANIAQHPYQRQRRGLRTIPTLNVPLIGGKVRFLQNVEGKVKLRAVFPSILSTPADDWRNDT